MAIKYFDWLLGYSAIYESILFKLKLNAWNKFQINKNN